jgi:hypothetical protein
MRQRFVVRVKEKEAELKEAEKEVWWLEISISCIIIWHFFSYMFWVADHRLRGGNTDI